MYTKCILESKYARTILLGPFFNKRWAHSWSVPETSGVVHLFCPPRALRALFFLLILFSRVRVTHKRFVLARGYATDGAFHSVG